VVEGVGERGAALKSQKASRLAGTMALLALAFSGGVVVMAVLNAADTGNLSASITGVVAVLVGWPVASRRPENPIGWLFLGGALVSAFRALTAEYAIYGIQTDPGAVPLPQTAAGLSNAVTLVGPVLLFVLVPLYFPTGRPVGRRWGLIAWLALGGLPVAVVVQIVAAGYAVYGTGLPNPWAVDALRPVVDVLRPIEISYYIGLIFFSTVSLVVRFWRSRGEERQQLKWFTFAAAFIPIWFLTNGPVDRAFPVLFTVLDALVIAAVPVAAGVAIFKYRLYDIDVIINRALVYAALTATLVLVYLGSVVGLQYVFRSLGGGESSLAVVASTLLIAALFNPLRRRVQGFIDRQFYRRKYDAARTLEAFSFRLRGASDLEQLTPALLAVVRDTVQPEHASVWLLEPPARDTNGRK
jgi:hypothetical protein